MESQGPPAGRQEPARGLFSVYRPPAQNGGCHGDGVSVPVLAGGETGAPGKGVTNSRLCSVRYRALYSRCSICLAANHAAEVWALKRRKPLAREEALGAQGAQGARRWGQRGHQPWPLPALADCSPTSAKETPLNHKRGLICATAI